MVALQVREKSFVDESSAIDQIEFIHATILEREREGGRDRERNLGFHDICLTLEGLMMELAEPA